MNFVGLFVSFLISISAFSYARKCEQYFSQPYMFGDTLFRGYLKTSSGRVYVKVEKPTQKNKKPKHWVLLIHGLLDSHRGWNDVAPLLLSKGVGVIRLDLLGHGKTFFNEYKSTLENSDEYKVPYKIDFSENVQLVADVLEILRVQGIENPVLVGHSMGGAVALAASKSLPTAHAKTVLISPYVYRLERRALEKTFASYFWGFNSMFFDLMPSFYRDFIERWMTDFFSDPVMYKNYEKFAAEKVLEENAHLTDSQLRKMIRYHIKAGIATTKGLRDFDAIKIARSIDSTNDYLILLGRKDELLDIHLQQRLEDSLPSAELVVEDNAGHMIINQNPQFVVKQILEFLNK